MADTDLRVPCSFEPRDPRDPKERSGRLLANTVNARGDAGDVRTGVAKAASPDANRGGNAGAPATGVPAHGHAGTAAIADAKLTPSPAALNSPPSSNLLPQGVVSKTAAFKTTSTTTTTAITTTAAGSPSQANAHVVSSSLNPAPGRERATQRRDSRPRLRLPASRTDLFATIKRQCCGFFSVGSGRVANGFLDAQRALELVRVFFFNEARETTIGAGEMCAYS